ncbi:MAG TPA: flagellar hook-basal body complex protein FliE [Candidatus Baltobacteraceae bacterium]|jgi:flagellar hook-basal body complex protein FliE
MDISTNYKDAMSKVVTGTFVPDMSPGGPKTEPLAGDAAAIAGAGNVAGTSFKDTVKSMLADVNDKMTTSDKLSSDLATGKTTDVNKVVTSVEEANLEMQFALAIRNKLLDAYTEVSRMQM